MKTLVITIFSALGIGAILIFLFFLISIIIEKKMHDGVLIGRKLSIDKIGNAVDRLNDKTNFETKYIFNGETHKLELIKFDEKIIINASNSILTSR